MMLCCGDCMCPIEHMQARLNSQLACLQTTQVHMDCPRQPPGCGGARCCAAAAWFWRYGDECQCQLHAEAFRMKLTLAFICLAQIRTPAHAVAVHIPRHIPAHLCAAAGKISTADMVKPIKAPPPPPPGLAPPARQRGRKKAGAAAAAAAGVPPPPARRQVAPQAPPPPSRKQLQQQARATAAAMRASVAPNYDVLGTGGDAQLSPESGAGGSGLRFSSKLKFLPGQRPVELQVSTACLC